MPYRTKIRFSPFYAAGTYSVWNLFLYNFFDKYPLGCYSYNLVKFHIGLLITP